MIRTLAVSLVSSCLLVAVGCKSSAAPQTDRSATAEQEGFSDPLPDIMHAKLAHARAVLAGLVTEDYAEIESSAVALRRLSRSTEWMVTDSVTYVVMSDEFRSIVDTMADDARARDLTRTTSDFTRMTESCVLCHQYLRKELFERDLPDKVSQRDDDSDVLASLIG